ncbi:hypothetical protein [Hymenobacter daeguensis]
MSSSVVIAKPVRKVAEKQPSIFWNNSPNEGILIPKKIEKVIKGALAQLPALTTMAVVEAATGTCLAHLSNVRHFDPAVAAACGAEMVRQQQQTMTALNMRGERLEDILIPFRKQLHLIRLAKNGQWFGYLVVKAQDTSLALAREVLKSIIP